MNTRPYIVTEIVDGMPSALRLIEAPTGAQALSFVTKSRFKVEAANAAAVMSLMSQGIKPEKAGAAPA